MRLFPSFSFLGLTVVASAYSIPPALQTFYNGVKNGGCKSWLYGNNYQTDGYGKPGFGFCTDTPGIIYLSGRRELGDMDVDCDGSTTCHGDGTWQGQTAFDWQLQSQGYGLKSLDASKHAYVVLGTRDIAVDSAHGGPVAPLSVVAVVCNGQLHYGVFGDTNGEHSTGVASIGLANICFPNEGLHGNNGHTKHDVLYIAFTDPAAVPGRNGAKWHAQDAKTFEASLKNIGDRMLEKVFGNGHQGPITDCEWPGHCKGASCKHHSDCSDPWSCQNGICG